MEIGIETPDYVQAMRKAAFYPHAVTDVSLRETHISWVFLTGSRVYKLKKPVDLGFLDFTTLEHRQHYCRREAELNRRLTTGIYLGVVPITENKGEFELDGKGRIVDYAVKMKQLPPADSLENRLEKGTPDPHMLEHLAEKLSRFYESAAGGPEVAVYGSVDSIRKNTDENFHALTGAGKNMIDHRRLRIVRSATKAFLDANTGLFQSRISNGRIREGHGDLRTDHIYFTGDTVQIIDCIEFNRRFRCGDVAGDLAFLAMEMDFNGFPRLSAAFVGAFLTHSKDYRLPALMDFYKCYRAMVRVKVNYLRLQQNGLESKRKGNLRQGLDHYLALAYRYALRFSQPVLWIVCGMVATGKSTIAQGLGDALEIPVIRSDVVRRQLFDRSSQERPVSGFEAGIYTPRAKSLTYGRMLLSAQSEIMENHRSVILDATFSRKENRRQALRLAGQAGARIIFVECFCRQATIRERLKARETQKTLSDARIHHLRELRDSFQELREIKDRCLIRIDTDKQPEENLRTIFMHTAAPDTAAPQDCVKRSGRYFKTTPTVEKEGHEYDSR